VCVSFFSFHAFFSKVAQSEPAKPARKQNLTQNSCWRAFKVMHFGITEKLSTDCMSLYNSAGLICKVYKEITGENAENCRCRQSHCRLTPPPQGNSANIRINLISPETRMIAYIFAANSIGLSSFKFLWWAPKPFCNRVYVDCRPFRVIRGRWFWHQSKRRMRPPISH